MRKLLLLGFLMPAAAAAFAQQSAIVVINTAPLAEHLSATGDLKTARGRLFSREADDYRAALRRDKAPLAARILERGLNIRNQTETLLNTIIVDSATDADLVWLRSLPGVKAAEFSVLEHVNLDTATSIIGAPQVWTQLGGQDQAGRGVKVGVLDTGIDQTHPMFSDSGFTAPAGFPKFDNTTNQAYTTNKVIVARNYVCPVTGTCNVLTSTFDRNSSDGGGHGTLVASIIAGRAATSPLGTSVAGVAPGAFLGSYKVFSSAGSGETSSVLSAFNDAAADGMDVINYSGGSGAFPQPLEDVYYQLIRNAASLGIVVVVSAGNSGPFDASIGSPAVEPDLIAAGASTNSHRIGQVMAVLGPGTVATNLQSISFAINSDPALTSPLGPATLVDSVAVDSTRQLCNAVAANTFTGNIVLVQARGSCTTPTKLTNLAKGGAIGMVMYDNLVETLGFFLTTGATIPSVTISLADGNNLIAFLNAHPGGAILKIDPFATLAQTADQVAGYSSRGPDSDLSIKPDLVAPGDMYGATQSQNSSAQIYSTTRYIYARGTSFAAPMTAGSAALLKAARPTLTNRDIKSALVNSASPVTSTQDGALISVMNSGGGRLNLPAAMSTTLAADPVSTSFGMLALAATSSKSATVQLKNIGTANETFAVAVVPSVTDPALSVTTDKTTVSLAAGASTSLTISMAAKAQLQGVFEGFVTATSQTSTTSIRIPYWMIFGRPTIAPGGLVDAAAFGKNVAPGAIMSLFGTSLGGADMSASKLPLPGDLNHSSVYVYARDSSLGQSVTQIAPLFFSSAGQVNFQMPYTLAPGREGYVLALLQGQLSSYYPFAISAAAPAIFTAGTSGVVTHGIDNSPVTSASPAAAGEVVTIYCTGLGAVTGSAVAGAAAPSNPVSTTPTNPVVTIGGKTAAVQFSGLTPGATGLYQVNATIPAGLASGSLQLSMTMLGAASNSVTTFVK